MCLTVFRIRRTVHRDDGIAGIVAWRRPAARGSVAAAALIAVVTAGAGWTLDRYLASVRQRIGADGRAEGWSLGRAGVSAGPLPWP